MTVVRIGPQRKSGTGSAAQTARTVARNLSTSNFSLALSLESACADESTWAEAVSVWPAPSLTCRILVLTWAAPCAACWTLREMSLMEAPCSSIATAITALISEMRLMVPLISLMVETESCVADCMPEICMPISSVALGGLGGQRLHLLGDDGEAAASFASARRLDRGVESEQVGLLGDGGDEVDHVTDMSGGVGKLGDAAVGAL